MFPYGPIDMHHSVRSHKSLMVPITWEPIVSCSILILFCLDTGFPFKSIRYSRVFLGVLYREREIVMVEASSDTDTAAFGIVNLIGSSRSAALLQLSPQKSWLIWCRQSACRLPSREAAYQI